MIDYVKDREETLLVPHEHSFRIEAWLYDCKYLNSMNTYGEFCVEFAPYSPDDDITVTECLDNAITMVELLKDPYSRKVPRPKVQRRSGIFYSNQLFVPKVNVNYQYTDELVGKLASVSGYLRDLPDGEIVINVSYVDVYDDTNGIDDAAPAAVDTTVTDDDW